MKNYEIIIIFSYNFRFGAFEEFKKHLADKNGVLDAKHRLLCGLGKKIFTFSFKFIEN